MHHTSNEPRVMQKCFKTDQVPRSALSAAKKAVRENMKLLHYVLLAESETDMHQALVSFRVRTLSPQLTTFPRLTLSWSFRERCARKIAL
jgi:hypothetical protein